MQDQQAGETNRQPPPPSPFEAAIEQRVTALEIQNRAKNNDSKAERVLSDVKTGEWWLIGINGLLLIVTIIIACIYNGQLTQMRTATEEATKATKATRDSAYAACIGAKVSVDSLNEAMASEATNRATTLAAIYQGEAALRSQTANVIVHFKELVTSEESTGVRVAASEVLTNYGTSPAADVRFVATIKMVHAGDVIAFSYPFGESTSGIIPRILQGQSRPLPEENGRDLVALKVSRQVPKFLSPGDMKDFAQRKMFIAATARVTYRDVFGITHWSQTCQIFFNRATQFPNSIISTGNDECTAYNRNDTASVLLLPSPLKAGVPEQPINCVKPPN